MVKKTFRGTYTTLLHGLTFPYSKNQLLYLSECTVDSEVPSCRSPVEANSVLSCGQAVGQEALVIQLRHICDQGGLTRECGWRISAVHFTIRRYNHPSLSPSFRPNESILDPLRETADQVTGMTISTLSFIHLCQLFVFVVSLMSDIWGIGNQHRYILHIANPSNIILIWFGTFLWITLTQHKMRECAFLSQYELSQHKHNI